MATKKTIAVITSSPAKASAIADTFLREKCNLLLVTDETEGYDKISADIKKKSRSCKTEVHHCMKDGCWEADAIIMDVGKKNEEEVASLIKEVATQKVVINITRDLTDKNLQQLLPYSRVTTLSEIPSSFTDIIGDD